MIQINTTYFDPTNIDLLEMERVLTHEFMHVIAFDPSLFSHF